jgi:phosphopantothenoylcysteine decarboxylase/phosphopantothenate--cysteine ligase
MKDKNIIVGITGGIASYKAAELVRILVRKEARVKVAMTQNATRFVAPLTFEALSGNRVIWDMFARDVYPIDHITWAQEADLIIIAPATANFIGKMAHGIADDFLSTLVLAATHKILVCPSMNERMYKNPAVTDNMRLLQERGITVMAPGEGELACGTEGPGRLPDPEDIAEQAGMLISPQDLSGMRILVTAGATVEPIDPVRHITNRSSGKMGYALAKAARRRGADVTLVSGPTALAKPFGVTLRGVKTAEEMRQAVFDKKADCDVIIKAAAVCDFRPEESSLRKIKKRKNDLTLKLIKNQDILEQLGCMEGNSHCLLVGFAAETDDLVRNAKEKLKTKNVHMIVANDVSRDDAGFETDTNIVKILYGDGRIEDLPLMMKDELADLILDRIKTVREDQRGSKGGN